MHSELHEHSVTLRISADEYRTVQEVLAEAYNLDSRIIQVSPDDIDLLTRHFAAAPCSGHGEKALTLSREQLGRLGLIFTYTTSIVEQTEVGSPLPPLRSVSPLREDRDVRELGSKLSELMRQYHLLIQLPETLRIT